MAHLDEQRHMKLTQPTILTKKIKIKKRIHFYFVVHYGVQDYKWLALTLTPYLPPKIYSFFFFLVE